MSTNEQKADYIKGLLAEREHYVRYDNPERLAEVDAELARVGAKGRPASQRATKMTKPAGEAL